MEFNEWAKLHGFKLTGLSVHERMDLVEIYWAEQAVKLAIAAKKEKYAARSKSKAKAQRPRRRN